MCIETSSLPARLIDIFLDGRIDLGEAFDPSSFLDSTAEGRRAKDELLAIKALRYVKHVY